MVVGQHGSLVGHPVSEAIGDDQAARIANRHLPVKPGCARRHVVRPGPGRQRVADGGLGVSRQRQGREVEKFQRQKVQVGRVALDEFELDLRYPAAVPAGLYRAGIEGGLDQRAGLFADEIDHLAVDIVGEDFLQVIREQEADALREFRVIDFRHFHMGFGQVSIVFDPPVQGVRPGVRLEGEDMLACSGAYPKRATGLQYPQIVGIVVGIPQLLALWRHRAPSGRAMAGKAGHVGIAGPEFEFRFRNGGAGLAQLSQNFHRYYL